MSNFFDSMFLSIEISFWFEIGIGEPKTSDGSLGVAGRFSKRAGRAQNMEVGNLPGKSLSES